MKLIKNEKYEITWKDTFGFNGWYSEKDIDKITDEIKCEITIGFLIKETKNYIILAMGRASNDDFLPYHSPKWIPKGFIKTIKKLKYVNNRN